MKMHPQVASIEDGHVVSSALLLIPTWPFRYFARVIQPCQTFKLRVWPRHKDCLLMTRRRTITPSSSIAPTNINCIRFPASKNRIRTKGNENRFSIISCNSLISSAQLVPSTALAHRSSAPLLALAPLPLAQQFYASDHVFPCHLWPLLQHALLVPLPLAPLPLAQHCYASDHVSP
jgi:hypothetical protein